MRNISISLETSVVNTYDNKGAYETLQAMMKRNEKLSIKFYGDKDQIPCAWIESANVAGFKYQLKSESLNGLLHYLIKGEATEFDSNPEDLETIEEGKDFQQEVMWALIKAEHRLQFTPLFRENPGYISAIFPSRKGKVFFKIARTTDMLNELREYKQAV